MGRKLFNFIGRDDGSVAIIFAVMAIPFIAMAGWAVDYLRIQHVKEFLQIQVDTAALNSFVEDGRSPEQQWALAEAAANGEISRQYQGNWARNIALTHSYLSSASDMVEVSAQADVPLAFIHLLPGIPDTQRVSVSAVAQFFDYKEVRQPPDTSLLDPEAGDFNRLWMYCYWPNRPENDPDMPKRTRMVPVADNGGSEFEPDFGSPPTMAGLLPIYTEKSTSNPLGLDGITEGVWRMAKGGGNNEREYEYMWPDCTQGSYLSFRLENVRFSRTQPAYWDQGAARNNNGDRITGRFDYYTDTFFELGSTTEQYAGLFGPPQYTNGQQKMDILETVLCNSLQECRPVSDGGIIPDHKPRAPQRATGSCEPGKYMYYGWEDRPPGLIGQSRDWQDIAWTDRDYDDIRIIIKCPTFETVGERNSRLVQ